MPDCGEGVDVTGAVTSDTGTWAAVPHWILHRLVAAEKLSALALFVALTEWENQATKDCWPSHKSLAERLGVAVSTIKRWSADLVSIGALTVEARRNPKGDQDSNRYHLRRSDQMSRPGAMGDPTPRPTDGLRTKTILNQKNACTVQNEPLVLQEPPPAAPKKPNPARDLVIAITEDRTRAGEPGIGGFDRAVGVVRSLLADGWGAEKIREAARFTVISPGALEVEMRKARKATEGNGERWVVPQ